MLLIIVPIFTQPLSLPLIGQPVSWPLIGQPFWQPHPLPFANRRPVALLKDDQFMISS